MLQNATKYKIFYEDLIKTFRTNLVRIKKLGCVCNFFSELKGI